MSSAKRRGQARGNAPGDSGNRPSRGPNPARGRVAPFDGPASRGSGSGAGSQSQASGPPAAPRRPSDAGSRAPSQAATQPPSQSVAQTPLIGRDPAREGPAPRATDGIKNVDMPASFYNIDDMYSLPTEFVKRPGFNATGRQITMNVNSYLVKQLPNKIVYQYDVIIGSGAEKRVVQQKAWHSKARRQATNDERMIYDGNKLAWSLKDMGQVKVMVDLDQEEGRGPSKDGKNAFRVHITPTKKLDLSHLKAYMEGKIQHNTSVLESINFMDHLLREGPSQNTRLVPIKRSFFARNGERMDLGSAVEVFRGVYQSMRPAQGNKMIINLDVAISSFWKPQPLLAAIVEKNRWRDPSMALSKFNDSKERDATKKYLRRLMVKSSYKGNPLPDKVWKIENLARVTAETHKIEWRNQSGGTGEQISVAAYFLSKYNLQLNYPKLPLIEMTKKMKGQPVYFPIELLVIAENQRYGAKLDESQTANMIKFAVSPPSVRNKAIEEGKSWLQWESDQHLKAYGLEIGTTQMVTQARILPPPGIQFGPRTKVEQPGTKGRWDLRGKTFHTPNPQELTSWGIGIFPGRQNLGQAQIEKFAMDMVKQYRGHGGVVANTKPHMMMLNADPGAGVNELYQAVGNAFNMRPQMLVFVVQNKDSQHYLRIKKSCDCRFGVVSQVMQAAQVGKANPQYISNVLMKFNAKLGGSTSAVVPDKNSGFKGKFGAPTVFIGADVSHASPGSDQASMAALTVSFDKQAARYAAGCQTNGRRVEMITERNFRTILGPLLTGWMSQIGGGNVPAQVYYMRDGVSEGQFIQVMQEEVPHIRAVLDKLAGGAWKGKLTVIVASKRHHIRAFPKGQDADQKGNPLPGTLIEKDVTTPLDFDFYLYSHIALQGTSRPVHYTVLKDEANHPPHVLQNMIYEHCYQYMRSTTSVSLHPAVYYAHLASNRAKAHENVAASQGPQGGAGFKQNLQASSDTPRSSEVPDLIAMNESTPIRYSMWYI